MWLNFVDTWKFPLSKNLKVRTSNDTLINIQHCKFIFEMYRWKIEWHSKQTTVKKPTKLIDGHSLSLCVHVPHLHLSFTVLVIALVFLVRNSTNYNVCSMATSVCVCVFCAFICAKLLKFYAGLHCCNKMHVAWCILCSVLLGNNVHTHTQNIREIHFVGCCTCLQ